MSKERARRRAARLAEAAERRRLAERRARRRAFVRRLRPRMPTRSGRTGRLFVRRSRAQRAGITLCVLAALGATWFLLDTLALRVAVTALLLVALPALVVLTLDRRI